MKLSKLNTLTDTELLELLEQPGNYSPASLGWEYVRRNSHNDQMATIKTAGETLKRLRPFRFRKQEHFILITLNSAYQIVRCHTVTVGLLNKTMVHPREIFKRAFKDNSAAIIVAHNHPSGNRQPSPEDISITKRLRKAGEVLGISLLDHIILTKDSFYSFLEDGKL